MSASFYDLLKFAKTGIAAPSMTHYDKMRALAMAGGGKVKTLTGVPPMSFKSNGKPLISLSMLGNAQQTGTPSPQSIIMPEFVGVRTGNLYDNNAPYIARYYYDSSTNRLTKNDYNAFVVVNVEAGMRYFVKGAKRYNSSTPVRWCTSSSTPASDIRVVRTGTFLQSDTFILDANPSENYLSIFLCGDSDYNRYGTVENAVATNGYDLVVDNGFKIPISCAGQATPVYLGQTQTVRNIYKLVLTGDEGWGYTSGMHRITISENLYKREIERIAICTHYEAIENQPSASIQNNQLTFLVSSSGNNYMYIRDTRFENTVDFKSYLAEQYAAGTPVTVWYVLATPETGIVNEPLCKIGDYADELHIGSEVTIPTVKGQNTITVDTDLQPSSVTITYTR